MHEAALSHTISTYAEKQPSWSTRILPDARGILWNRSWRELKEGNSALRAQPSRTGMLVSFGSATQYNPFVRFCGRESELPDVERRDEQPRSDDPSLSVCQ